MEVREGGALRGSSQMMSDRRCLHPRVVAKALQVSPEILDQAGDSGGAHSLIGGLYFCGHSLPGGVVAAMVRQRGTYVRYVCGTKTFTDASGTATHTDDDWTYELAEFDDDIESEDDMEL